MNMHINLFEDDKERLEELYKMMRSEGMTVPNDGCLLTHSQCYFEYPIDGRRLTSPRYQRYIVDFLDRIVDREGVMLTTEGSGVLPVALLADRRTMPFYIAHKFHFPYDHRDVELKVDRPTYGIERIFRRMIRKPQTKLYLPGGVKGRKIAIVDTVVPTGEEPTAIIDALRSRNAEITGAYYVVELPDYRVREKFEEKGVTMKSIMAVLLDKNGIICVPSIDVRR
jgi:adenine/guanine phosphoribosyltransferase-like PRPP-binding protein